MLTVLGFERSKGEYQGFNFDNLKLYCESDVERDSLTGSAVETIKVPFANLDFTPKVGDVIKPVYNRFGKVEAIEIAD